ncbi:VOC family protein [Streptomyces sp. NBC_01190]|uniref:VOC family protein n=1 Tax=Streptomyces sp. NBC_01190 TaxID=2903767 RepID=UPI0038631B59|nr:VOC family protein [Streptomyces sp. NBC_01190]
MTRTQPTQPARPTQPAQPVDAAPRTPPPPLTMTGTVLDTPDPHALADFYRRLLGWEVTQDEPDWVKLNPPGGGPGLSFQAEPAFVRPHWPATPGEQQMMLHLDIETPDLAASVAHARALGATLPDFQPQPDVRVLLDPAGHPFCLWTPTP